MLIHKPIIYVCTCLLAVALLVSGCAAPAKTGSTYQYRDLGQAASVDKGRILSIREIEIAGSNQIGKLAGAGIGAVGGSGLGRGNRANIAGAIAGAVAGGLLGSAIEENATKAVAFEFIIEKNDGQVIAVAQTNEEALRVGDPVLIVHSDKIRIVLDQNALRSR